VSLELAAGAAVSLLREVRGRLPVDTQARVRELAMRFAPLLIDLLPERDRFSGQLDHGLLIRGATETVYVTCRGVAATPWLLHQVHDFREGDLLHVDGESLSVGEAVAALDELLAYTPLRERLIDTCIINRHLKQREYQISDTELQSEVDRLRRRRGLISAEETERWMRAHGVSHARLEAMAAAAARVRRLRHELCAAEIESWYHDHRAELTRAALIRLWFANDGQARRALPRSDFFALANQLLAEDLRSGARVHRLDTQVVARCEVEAAFGAEVFERAGGIVGPQTTAEGAFLAYVSAIEPARELDAETRDLIERRLFAGWLCDQRERACVEWNWAHE
jgi:putative peptide maturation system protein